MREPNFSESQLQQATNTAFVQRIAQTTGKTLFAYVPSLLAEYDLGWDSAFFLPWLSHLPNAEHDGCNFFVQYKLSWQLNSPRAKEWAFWHQEYYRFKVPHLTRDASGSYVDDYHQWDRLEELAAKGYPTFYATNATLSRPRLVKLVESGTLLDHVPLLDVRTTKLKHKYATFVPGMPLFRLHSEKEESNLLSFSQGLSSLSRERQASFAAATERVLEDLRAMAGSDEQWLADLAKIDRLDAEEGRLADLQPPVRRLLLMAFVHRHIGAHLLWYPSGG